MALVLRAGQGNRNAYRSLIAAEYCGVKVQHVNVVPKVFVLETPDGPVSESTSMARYIAQFKGDSTLLGSSLYEYAQIEQWIIFAASEIEEGLKRWIYPSMGLAPYDAQFVERRVASLKISLHALNTHLAESKYYLVGHGITLADIALTCALHFGFTRTMTKSFTSEFPHVEQYFWAHVNHPNFKKILGEVKQAESVPAVPKRKMKQRVINAHKLVNMMIENQDKMVNQISEAQKKRRVN